MFEKIKQIMAEKKRQKEMERAEKERLKKQKEKEADEERTRKKRVRLEQLEKEKAEAERKRQEHIDYLKSLDQKVLLVELVMTMKDFVCQYNERISEYLEEISNLEREISDLESKNYDLEREISDLESKNYDLENEILYVPRGLDINFVAKLTGRKLEVKKDENKPIMTKPCHRFDTIKVHYCIRSNGAYIPEGVTPKLGVTS